MAHKLPNSGSILALDIGDVRIGVAVASVIAKLPRPLEIVRNDENARGALRSIIDKEMVTWLVIGIPRNLDGLETPQSQKIHDMGQKLAAELGLEVTFVDESLSSRRADEYLRQNPKEKIAQDSLAACFILDEFFATISGDESR